MSVCRQAATTVVNSPCRLPAPLAGQQLFEQMVPLEHDATLTVVAITSTNALAMPLGFL